MMYTMKSHTKILYSCFLSALISSSVAQAESCAALLSTDHLESAVEAGRQQANTEGLVCAGRGLARMKRYQDAIAELHAAEKLAKSPYEQLLIAISIARTTRDAGDVDQAIILYQRGYALATELRQRQAQFVNLNEMGELFLMKHDAKSALDAFTRGYALAANDNERADSNQYLASAHRQAGDLNRAIEYQLKGSLLELRSGELNDYFYAMLELADLRTLNKDFQAAQKDVETVLVRAKDVQSDYWIARSLLYMGKLELARGHLAESRPVFEQAQMLAMKLGDLDLLKLITEANTAP